MTANSISSSTPASSAIFGSDQSVPRRPKGFFCRSGPNIRAAIPKDIAANGSAGWKYNSRCHQRSLTQKIMDQLKQLGDGLYSRIIKRQVSEDHGRAAIINAFTYLRMLKSFRVGEIAPAA